MTRSLILAGGAILALTGTASAADHPCYENHWLEAIGVELGVDLPVGTNCGNGNVDNNGAPGVGFTQTEAPPKHEPPPCEHEWKGNRA